MRSRKFAFTVLLVLAGLLLFNCQKKSSQNLVDASWQDLDKEMKDNCVWCGKAIESHLINHFEFRGVYPYHYLNERDTSSINRQIFRKEVVTKIARVKGFQEGMQYSNFCSNKCYLDFKGHFFSSNKDTLFLTMKSYKRKNNIQRDSVHTIETSYTYYIKANEK